MCEQVVVLAKLVKNNAALGFDTLINEHERDYRAVRVEWVAITDASLYASGALSLMQSILEDLIVHEDRIGQNVNQAASLIATEALMFRLADKMGKQAAHKLLYEISMEARTTSKRSSSSKRITDRPLVDLLAAHPEIKSIFTPEELQLEIDPAQHIGLAGQLTDRVVKNANDRLAGMGKTSGEITPCPLQDTGICK